MSEERGAWGTYDNGVNVGASHTEQMGAGVNQYDDGFSATIKVNNMRMGQAREKLAQAEKALYATGYIPPATAPTKFPWQIALNTIVLLLVAYFCYIVFQSGKYTYLGERWVPLKSASVPAKSLKDMQASNMLRISPIFVLGTPIQDIYKGCKTANCYEPDISAFDQFKKFAAHPDSYEGDLCNYYIGPTGYQPDQVQPIWKIDRKASTCVVKNFSVVYADVLAKNKTYMMKIAVFAAIALALLIGFNVLLRKSNK